MKTKLAFLLFFFAALDGSARAQVNNARMLSTPNAQTGTTYTFVPADTTRITTFNNPSPVAVTLPNGASQGFGAGTVLSVLNLGAGTVTITCSSCTINGAATLSISQNQGTDIYGGAGSGAANYVAALPSSGGGTPAGVTGQFQFNSGGSFTAATGITTPDGNSLNIKGPTPWIDSTQYGVRALSTFSTITVTTNGTASVSTGGVGDFLVNDGIVIPGAGTASAPSTPSAPTVAVVGATGSVTIPYECVAIDAHNGWSAASSAASATTAPTVFGQPATHISAISRNSGASTVTGTTSVSMPFSSGTYQAHIANVTGGTTQFSGLQTVTVTSATTFTYSQAGATESGTVVAGSYIKLEAASYVVTSVQATAGSNQIVLTTSISHNIPLRNSGTTPVKIFLDGINFAIAGLPPGYANGTFGVAGVTANTITVNTAFTSPVTTTATANASQATSGVAQMTVTVEPYVYVACPAISGTTQFYAVYANYGPGYTLVNFTPWGANILQDYGPAWTQTGLVVPNALSALSSGAPSAASSNETYRGQITNINGATLTVNPAVTASLSGVLAYHDNGSAFLNAVSSACSGGNTPVYLPKPSTGFAYYLFSAPLDLTASGCSGVEIADGGPLWLDGTLSASGVGTVHLFDPSGLSGVTAYATGGNSGSQTYITGKAPTLMASGPDAERISGMNFNVLSNGQIGLEINNAANSDVSNSSFLTIGNNNLSAIPLLYYNAQFAARTDSITGSCDDNTMYPVPQANTNSQLGDVAYWPVPCMLVTGAFQPEIHMTGVNYFVYRGIEVSNLYPNIHTYASVDIDYVKTFQAPQQALVTVYGDSASLEEIRLRRSAGDSVQNPLVACVTSDGGRCAVTFYNDKSFSVGTTGMLSGAPFGYSIEIPYVGSYPAQNTTEFSFGTTLTDTIPPSAAPSIGSGFGTSAAVVNAFGYATFQINVGTSNTGTGVLTLPTSPLGHGWACTVTDGTTTSASVFYTRASPTSTTSVTLQNYTNLGATGAWVDSDVLEVRCAPY